MIQNEHQYKIIQTKLRELEQASIDLDSNSNNLSERLFQAEKKGIQFLIDRLRLEVVEYDNLKQQRTPIKIGSIEDLAIDVRDSKMAVVLSKPSSLTHEIELEKVGTWNLFKFSESLQIRMENLLEKKRMMRSHLKMSQN